MLSSLKSKLYPFLLTTTRPLKYQFSTKTYPSYSVIPIPLLSPSMTDGKIVKWYFKIGEEIKLYSILFEIETNSLVKDSKEAAVLQIESHDIGYLAKIFYDNNMLLKPQTPIALICDNKEDVSKFNDFNINDIPIIPSDNTLPTDTFYPIIDNKLPEPPKGIGRGPFYWQAYVKLDKLPPHSCSR